MFEFGQVLRIRDAWLVSSTYSDLRILWLHGDGLGGNTEYTITLVAPAKAGSGWGPFGTVNTSINVDAFEVDTEWPS